jgi:hypothetical protein
MEPVPIRDEVHDFIRACQALIGFADAHNGLTSLECEVACDALRELEEEVDLFSSEADEPPFTATMS